MPCDILNHACCLQRNDGLVKEALGYIIKVIYLVPLVCHQCAFGIFSKADSGGNNCVVGIGFTVCPHMKSKSVCFKALMDAQPDIGDRFTAELRPVLNQTIVQTLFH